MTDCKLLSPLFSAEDEKSTVIPTPGRSRGEKRSTKESTQGVDEAKKTNASLDDSQEENTKDTGQEKDAGTPSPKQGQPGVMDSPRYLRPKREKSRERSASPFRRNVVEPLPGGESSAGNKGSMVSLRSEASSASKGRIEMFCLYCGLQLHVCVYMCVCLSV